MLTTITKSNGQTSPSLRDLNNWAVQGRFNKTIPLTSFNSLTTTSGFYDVLDETNKPVGQEAGWPWYLLKIKQGGDATSHWATDFAIHWKTGAIFNRLYDAQTTGFQPWRRVHSNQWFPVKENETYVQGDELLYIDGEFKKTTRGYLFAGASTTVNLKTAKVISVYNITAGAYTITLDHLTAWFGCEVTVKPYPGSTGVILIATNSPAQLETDAGAFTTGTVTVPLTGNFREVKFIFTNGGQWERSK